ncbi:MAG: hypothetical protein ACXVLQ_13015 [Bacteriovorax sp.]
MKTFKILCILSFVLIPNSRATDIIRSELDSDLTKGKTIAIGKIIEEKDGSRYFIMQKQWTLSPSKLFLPKVSWFRGKLINQGEPGVTHFLSALGETNSKGELGRGIYKVISVNDDFVKIAIKKLANKKDFVGEINPSWQYCESDIECIQSKNWCGRLIGVNKKYQKDYMDFLKSKLKKADCSKDVPIQAGKAADSKCVENFCS